MGNLTSNGRWTRGKWQEHLKQGRGRWRERPEERDSLPSSSGYQLACPRRVRRYFRGGACSHEGLRLPTCSSLLQSTKMGKWLQGRGPGVSLGGLRGSLGRSFGVPGRSPVGFWSVLGGVRVSLGGCWSGFGDSPWCLGALKESSGEYLEELWELCGESWGALRGERQAHGEF